MSAQLIGVDTPAPAQAGKGSPVARMIAHVVDIGRRITVEVVYTLREDFRHGQISRDHKDWTP